ncbi:MAG: MarR family transcriptional regulator [Polyangiaceae bacterium]|nr:MarR family transcriptional regulator [Myxococcales bacterium]MCB9586116.1 MarR family transcriptional regulator [Polyangiaceae bacterium]MCB9606794.1 MarR family transcriptional regulator [Polyangiaceae bacterium]
MSMDMLTAIIELRRGLVRAFSATFSGEISARQAGLLREIRATPGTSQAALARATVNDPSFVVRMLDQLERRGLVTRKQSATDRREREISLTKAGLKALGPLDATFDALAATTSKALSKSEQAQFIALASKITDALGQVADSGGELEARRVGGTA